MQLIINGRKAVMKEQTSFEYVSENRLFGGADGYSMTVELPLKDCPENLAIFGHINRKDVVTDIDPLDCEMRAAGLYLSGTAVVVGIGDAEVKIQFLEGRSAQNYKQPFDGIYINELNLGQGPMTDVQFMPPSEACKPQNTGVALPWVNSSSNILQNAMVWDSDSGGYKWANNVARLSWMPYLIHISKRILLSQGYSYDFAEWENDERKKYLIICNVIPQVWEVRDYSRALPHWTIDEFFEKLELFLEGEFDWDHKIKKVTFRFTRPLLTSKTPIVINDVVDDHDVEISEDEDKCDYLESKNLAYKECDHNMQKFYSCDWYIDTLEEGVDLVRYDTLAELVSANIQYKEWTVPNDPWSTSYNRNKVLYAADINAYFIIREIDREVNTVHGDFNTYKYFGVLQPINQLGPRLVDDSDDASTEELDFVPVCIDYTDSDHGFCAFLPFDPGDETVDEDTCIVRSDYDSVVDYAKALNEKFWTTKTEEMLKNGEKSKSTEYYDRVYVGWWDGAMPSSTNYPHPIVADIEFDSDWTYRYTHGSLRINTTSEVDQPFYKIRGNRKTTFKFLADAMPDVRSLFYIRGKKYICEKITSTLSKTGMSKLMKGVFYEVV